MQISQLSSKYRLAIAFGASIGPSHFLFQYLTQRLGPVWGLVLGMVAAAVTTLSIYMAIESSIRQKEAVRHGANPFAG